MGSVRTPGYRNRESVVGAVGCASLELAREREPPPLEEARDEGAAASVEGERRESTRPGRGRRARSNRSLQK
jgi:hypothetical protein